MTAWLGERRLSVWVFLFFHGLHMVDTGDWPAGYMDIHDGNKREQHKLNFYPGPYNSIDLARVL